MKHKIISFILAFAVCVCVYLPASAAAPQKVKSLHPGFAAKLYSASLSGENIQIPSLQSLSVYPGSELDIVLVGSGTNPNLFFDQNGEPIKTADVTASKMRATSVVPEVYFKAGADLIDSVEIVVRNAGTPAAKPALRIAFSSDFNVLEPERFDFTVYISIDGTRQGQSGIKIAGTLGNPEIDIEASDIAVYADGVVLTALEDIPYIEIHADCGVTVAASLKQGRRYLVRAHVSDDQADMAAMENNHSLEDVIALDVFGFEYDDIYGVRLEAVHGLSVYSQDDVLLGDTTSTAMLPPAEKYYLVRLDA